MITEGNHTNCIRKKNISYCLGLLAKEKLNKNRRSSEENVRAVGKSKAT